jgi:CRP-like cAMP-binding protein
MDEADRNAVLSIAESIAPLDRDAFEPVLSAMRCASHEPGELVIAAGEREPREYFVLSGILKTFVGDAEGREATLAFHVGPCALTPSIARVADERSQGNAGPLPSFLDPLGGPDAKRQVWGRSRVNCIAMTKTRVAGFPSVALMECMLRSPSIQRWGDTVLRAELVRRADREWALAALSAAERLLQFRRDYAGLEDAIAHHHIASYLGITPVTLSRVRAQVRDHVLNASSRLP